MECCQTNQEAPLVVADELAVHLHLMDAARHDGPHQLLRSRLRLLQLFQKQSVERQEGLTVGSNGESCLLFPIRGYIIVKDCCLQLHSFVHRSRHPSPLFSISLLIYSLPPTLHFPHFTMCIFPSIPPQRIVGLYHCV